MLNETLKALRKQKGYSQEEVASRLNIVRQTVSKWEKGLSVPDADALVQIAELYEVSVGRLLGAPEETPNEKNTAPDPHEIAEQLSRINEQLVIRNRRSARILKVIGAVLLVYLICLLLSLSAFSLFRVEDAPVIETHIELNEFEED